MQAIKPLRYLAISIGLVLFSLSLLCLMALFLPWYAALAVLAILATAGTVGYRRLTQQAKRSISENVFVILSGGAAIVIVLFVAYLLIHIFLLGKSNLSWSFLVEAPSEGLTGGGIFPAIVGTALLVVIMSLAGVPVGTVTAIYLTEYASERSIIARFIRFAVNTLAGVPAIVFGLFGLGFFIGTIGRQMDAYSFNTRMEKMETLFKSEGSPLAGGKTASPDQVRALFVKDDAEYWNAQIEQARVLSEIDGGAAALNFDRVRQFYSQRNTPHWGQPALIWAALTLALLTLPVVIVSVEEAIKAVPKDLREASLALGATKWMTIRKVVIPGAITGIMTGGILAVSRGAGEVAPILFTGAAYYLPELPRSLSSQFMELGYHIYVLTTQSTNVEATKGLLYATTFVLLLLTFTLNFSAIFLRSRVRARQSRLGQ
jgi:ABC-type phosphate transport system permease subunit